MKEKPIPFSTEMVKAIFEGRKTQTRRLKGLEKVNENPGNWHINKIIAGPHVLWSASTDDSYAYSIKCPYQIGQTLWVRENHTFGVCSDTTVDVHYKADEEVITKQVSEEIAEKTWEWVEKKEVIGDGGSNWRPPIFMPRWASRINLEVTNIRVERINQISDEDAVAEGVYSVVETDENCTAPDELFKKLWDSINAKRGYPWESNPYVWLLEFKQKEV